MPDESLFLSPAPYHVLSYGALLGTQFFHTFINSITSFKVLERAQFGILQRAVFPAYFGIQTAAPVVLALTYPGGSGRTPQGLGGVLHPTNRWGVLVPLATAFVTGLANLVYFLPETNRVTAQRRQQESKDGKDIKALNKKFASQTVNVVIAIQSKQRVL
ncbi:hypothetical protein F4802DRAFT_364861 [Xylaria palmicola]|nr:hypothetical protein F4802DRAFT_364861 [Xylaria palmicola]